MGAHQKPTSTGGGLLHGVARMLQSITGPWTRDNLVSWVKLILVVLTVWWLGIQPFRIPSQSMSPTLNGDPGFFVGDRVFVNKWIYGPHVPFTNIRLFKLGEPRRWDVVVFRSVEPEEPNKILIKRVVGLPGERIHIYNGRVYVNGEALQVPNFMPDVYYVGNEPPFEEKLREAIAANRENPQEAIRAVEELYRHIQGMHAGGLLKYGVLEDDTYAVVPPNHYLMLGDNSAHSADGRFFGWVPHNHLLGRAFCVWWPFKHWRDLSGFTDTWSGLALLFGIPGLLIGYEICRAFFLLPWRVRGNALDDHLAKGERVLINRSVFGIRLSFPPLRLYGGRMPERGETVAYTVASDNGLAAADLVFGRIAGLPGDKVSIEDGEITVNGDSTGKPAVRTQESGDAAHGRAKWLPKKGATIPDDQYLVLADDASTVPDSRTVGWVPRESMVGIVSTVWWPPHRIRKVRKN